MKEKILKLVIASVHQIGEESESEVLKNANEDTLLFGVNLDSIGTVLLLTELEESIAEEFNLQISLSDERTMSQKTSPFLSVKILVRYLDRLINSSFAVS
ncbi:MAG: hypothetical protein WCI48_15540 [Bacteroidota bacterium]